MNRHTHVHTYAHILQCTDMHTHTNTCTRTHTYTHNTVHRNAYPHRHIHVHTCTYMILGGIINRSSFRSLSLVPKAEKRVRCFVFSGFSGAVVCQHHQTPPHAHLIASVLPAPHPHSSPMLPALYLHSSLEHPSIVMLSLLPHDLQTLKP